MATRRDVREAFYASLESATTLSGGDIGQEYPNTEEDLPRIVHDDNYRDAQPNWNSNGAPSEIVDNGDGTYDVKYPSMMQAVFTVLVLSDDEQEKEDIYEDLRSYFEKFEHPRWSPSTIQADVHDVDVSSANSQDSQSRDPPARGDNLTITLGFIRYYVQTVEDITEVQQDIDADNDGTVDTTYTTT